MISRLQRLWHDRRGVAAIEAAMLFPILILFVFGLWDMGNAMVANQRTITAAQVVGDLITRERVVTDTELENYIVAGELAFGNSVTTSYGVDILSVSFDAAGNPTQEWRETRNMQPSANALPRSADLGGEGEGTVVVTVTYTYTPLFTSFLTGALVMQEQAFLRGRRSAIVGRET